MPVPRKKMLDGSGAGEATSEPVNVIATKSSPQIRALTVAIDWRHRSIVEKDVVANAGPVVRNTGRGDEHKAQG